MNHDLMHLAVLEGVGLTMGAAIAIFTLARHLGQTPASRGRLTAALIGWFALVVALAASEVLHNATSPLLAGPGLGLTLIVPIVILSLTVRRNPALRQGLENMPLSVLIGINAIRVLGVTFVSLYSYGYLPAPFSPSAGWGDIAIGLTALLLARLVQRRPEAARPLIWLWNSMGVLDLVTAVSLGVTSSPGPLHLLNTHPDAGIMTTLPWMLIPSFLVPLLFCTHLAVYYRLSLSSRRSKALSMPLTQA